jgi:hypothetical protein
MYLAIRQQIASTREKNKNEPQELTPRLILKCVAAGRPNTPRCGKGKHRKRGKKSGQEYTKVLLTNTQKDRDSFSFLPRLDLNQGWFSESLDKAVDVFD